MNIEIHPCFFLSLMVCLLWLVLSITYKISAASNISQVSRGSIKNKAVELSIHANNACVGIKIHSRSIRVFSSRFSKPRHLGVLKA